MHRRVDSHACNCLVSCWKIREWDLVVSDKWLVIRVLVAQSLSFHFLHLLGCVMTRNFNMDSISAVGLMLLLHGILDWDTGLSCDKWEHVISLNACNLFTRFLSANEIQRRRGKLMGPSQISVKYPITLETLILVPSTPAKNKTKKTPMAANRPSAL